jgi:hypothetical protein
VALLSFLPQILSCANLGVHNIDLVGMELILTPLIKRVFMVFRWILSKKKERFKDFEPSVSISIFDLSDAILERC